MAVTRAMGTVQVVGNLTTDLIVRGLPELPVWGQEVAGTEHVSIAAGQAGYLAQGLVRLGCATRLLGIVGDDAPGGSIRDALSASGVDVASITTSRLRPTALTIALVRPDGERAFVSDFACQRDLDAGFVERSCRSLRDVAALCVVGLFNLPSLSPEQLLPSFARARSEGVLTVLDTGWDPDGWASETVAGTKALLAETDLFLPNRQEAHALTGLEDSAAAATTLQQIGGGTVVVKCGADGAVACDAHESVTAAASRVDARDAVGAGDAFNAAFLFAHLRGTPLRQSMEFANAAAGLYVTRDEQRHASEEDVRAAMRAGAAS
ncbi:MAG: ribokinase [Solirubrobacteraceae bacterium]|nr:ribokinase [Solirubrobacteraceae bacterium]